MYSECEQATVINIDENFVYLKAEPLAGCAHCSNKESCNMSQEGGERVLKASSTVELELGDRVYFELMERPLYLAILFYLLPAIFAVIGASLGYRYLPLFADKDLNALSGFVGGLAGSALLLFSFTVLRKSNERPQAHVLKKC